MNTTTEKYPQPLDILNITLKDEFWDIFGYFCGLKMLKLKA